VTNQDHLFNILDDVLLLVSGQGFPTPEKTYKLDGGWGLALSDLRRCFNEHRARIAELEAERDAAKAEAARAVEALERIRQDLELIAAGKEEEVRNDFSSGESHGWGMAYLHVCRIIGNAATQPALAWLAQREREAAARELRGLWSGWAKNDLYRSDVGEVWRYIRDRAAALTNQQPTACPRSEVRGEENNNA
jgi:hypothetical protein